MRKQALAAPRVSVEEALEAAKAVPLRTNTTDRTDIVRLYKFKVLDWSIWVWFMYIPRYTQQIIDHFDLRINIRGGRPLKCFFVTVRPADYPERYMWQYVLEGGYALQG